jgi:TPR repeat protein
MSTLFQKKTIKNRFLILGKCIVGTISLLVSCFFLLGLASLLLRHPIRFFVSDICIDKDQVMFLEQGVFYLLGTDGFEKDYTKAKSCFEEAARRGDAFASCMLGIFYEYGVGVKIDLKKALTCFHNAAEKGNIDAQAYLGMCYIMGAGTPVDVSKGLSYLELAASKNYAMAQYLLGMIYEAGGVVPQNINQAKKHYVAAVKQDCQGAKFRLLEQSDKFL